MSMCERASFGNPGVDHRFGHSERFERSSAHIFLSHIFLLGKAKQENVGEENKSGCFPQSSADGRNDDHGAEIHNPASA
jgi:hypothetical protein